MQYNKIESLIFYEMLKARPGKESRETADGFPGPYSATRQQSLITPDLGVYKKSLKIVTMCILKPSNRKIIINSVIRACRDIAVS